MPNQNDELRRWVKPFGFDSAGIRSNSARSVEVKDDKKPFRNKVRRRLIRAVGDLHPHIEVIRARAWRRVEEADALHWVADERTYGKGTHDAFLIIIKKP
jgi:hypothetical protein